MMETRNKSFLSVLFALFLILCSFANFAAAASSKSDVRITSVKIISEGNSNTYHPGEEIQFQVTLKNYGKQTDMFALSLWVDKYGILGLGRTSFIKSGAVNFNDCKIGALKPEDTRICLSDKIKIPENAESRRYAAYAWISTFGSAKAFKKLFNIRREKCKVNLKVKDGKRYLESDIYIDGVFMGGAQYGTYSLDASKDGQKHTFSIRREEYETYITEITCPPNAVVPLDVQMSYIG